MDIREKTVKALEKAIQRFERYSGDEYGREYNYTHVEVEVLEDAVALLKEDERAIKFQSDRLDALLKAQEPRVMTLWEAVGIIDRPVYLERNVLMPDKSINRQECWALVQATDDGHMIRLATPYGIEKWHVGAYGIGWRCWTSRPTDTQEAVKWE